MCAVSFDHLVGEGDLGGKAEANEAQQHHEPYRRLRHGRRDLNGSYFGSS
jgi:hypothetical protein